MADETRLPYDPTILVGLQTNLELRRQQEYFERLNSKQKVARKSVIDAIKRERAQLENRLPAEPPPPEVLSERESEVDQLIRDKGPLQGKEIADQTGIGEKVLSNHVIPALKVKRGLQNKRSRGYFYPT